MDEFIQYLLEQIGQPYLWGGQHTLLTPENYVRVINRKETSPQNRADAIAFCSKAFLSGAERLYAYDCSGLGMYWLQNVKGIYRSDMNANGMMGKTVQVSEPRRGYWVFRLTNGRATHIGYMISDTDVVHAKGRKYGVVKEKFSPSYWHRIGRPNCFDFDVERRIRVKGSVRVREYNSPFSKKICTVRNCVLPYLGQASEAPFWYMTAIDGVHGFITSNPRYTEVIE